MATAWLEGKNLALCPLSELGFLRVSTHPKALHSPMQKARAGLENFAKERDVARIGDDLPALESHPAKSEQVTDHYLADLAKKHGFMLATFDEGISHPAAVLVK